MEQEVRRAWWGLSLIPNEMMWCPRYMPCALLTLAVFFTASPAPAHPGNVAADGCHYCWTNCPKWGQVYGQRHCHRGRQRPRQTVHPPPARPPQAAQEGIRKRPIVIRDNAPRVVDADTLEMAGQRVRLQGIDAPEAAQTCRQATGHHYRCGERATEALRARIDAEALTCTMEGRDRYNRALSTCYTGDGTDLNAWLVRRGYALAYRRYSTKYVPEENQARAGRAGIWADEFVPPWAWRRGERLD